MNQTDKPTGGDVVENLYMPDCIRTFSGCYINVLNPLAENIRIEDIAHALSNQPRFGGHMEKFYSVAEHSINCCLLIKEKEHKLAALLHDASEAYLMDIPSPIKKHLTNYKQIEDGLMTVISNVFHFQYPLHEKVKEVDKYMLEAEWDDWVLSKNQKRKKPLTKTDFKKMFILLYQKYSNNGKQ